MSDLRFKCSTYEEQRGVARRRGEPDAQELRPGERDERPDALQNFCDVLELRWDLHENCQACQHCHDLWDLAEPP